MRRRSKGRHARFICQRSGFEVPYRYAIREPGTGLLIDRRLSDGRYNAVDHPQNYSKRDLADGFGLDKASPETFDFTAEPLIVGGNLEPNPENPFITTEAGVTIALDGVGDVDLMDVGYFPTGTVSVNIFELNNETSTADIQTEDGFDIVLVETRRTGRRLETNKQLRSENEFFLRAGVSSETLKASYH